MNLLDVVMIFLIAIPLLMCVWLSYNNLTDWGNVQLRDLRGHLHEVPLRDKLTIFIGLPILIVITIWLEVIYMNIPNT